MSHGVFGNRPAPVGRSQWTAVPSIPTYGSNPGPSPAQAAGSFGLVETIEERQGLTIPSDHLNLKKIYGGLGGLGESTLTINGANVPIDTSGLGLWIAKSAIAAAAGYYVGTHLGPKGSHAGLVGALASAFAGPIGLAATAYYYGR